MKVPYLISIVLWLTAQASCQVHVSASLTKAEYLEGEPIEVVVKITNIGSDPVAYEKGSGHVALEAEGQRKRPTPPNLWGCFAGEGWGGGAGGIDHPPLLAPGASTEFRYLLRDYQLLAGRYTVHASGQAGVRWKLYGSDLSAHPARFREGDSVPGADFDQTLSLLVRVGGESELRTVYEPWVKEASAGLPDRADEARDAISDMAPVFLEKTILGFAKYRDGAEFAIKGLSRIDTAEARGELIGLFDETSDLGVRRSIVHALAEMNSADQLDFFASLLPGHISESDDNIRQYAVLAIGRLGGEGGVETLQQFLRVYGAQASVRTRSVIAIALASGVSRKAIPILIGMYADSSGEVMNSVCGSLLSLTHMSWCDGSGNVSRLQSEWRAWWAENAPTAKLFGTDTCPALNDAPTLPLERQSGKVR